MNRLLLIAWLLFGITLPSELLAVELSKKFIDQMIDESDLIMIGKVEALSASDTSADQLARLRGIYGIKGLADVTLIYRTGIRELDPDCCEVGKTYLFFLRRQPNGLFVTVGGRQGSIEASSESKDERQMRYLRPESFPDDVGHLSEEAANSPQRPDSPPPKNEQDRR